LGVRKLGSEEAGWLAGRLAGRWPGGQAGSFINSKKLPLYITFRCTNSAKSTDSLTPIL